MAEYIPVEIVEKMSKQGMSELEIIDNLKSRGFDKGQINKAVKIALKEGILGKAGLPARPHIGAGPTTRKVDRHPIRPKISKTPVKETPFEKKEELPVKEPEPSMERQRIESVPMEKPPGKIVLPESLRPMEIPSNNLAPEPDEMPIPRLHSPGGPKREPKPIKAPLPKPRPAPRPTEKSPQAPTRPIKQLQRKEDITLEELVEGVVRDQLSAFNKTLSENTKRDERIETHVDEIDTKISGLAKKVSSKYRELNSKVDESEEDQDSIEARLTAIERAFKSLAEHFHTKTTIHTPKLETPHTSKHKVRKK